MEEKNENKPYNKAETEQENSTLITEDKIRGIIKEELRIINDNLIDCISDMIIVNVKGEKFYKGYLEWNKKQSD